MTARAKILTALSPPAPVDQIDQALRAAGYGSTVVTDPERLPERLETVAPDLVLIGQTVGETDGFLLLDWVKTLREDRQCAIALLADAPDRDMYLRAFDAEFDDVISVPVQPDVLTARVGPLTRLSVMWSEMHLRNRLAGHFGITSSAMDQQWHVTEGTILYVGRDDTEFSDLQNALGTDQTLVRADGVFAALDLLGETECNAVIFSADDDLAAARDFCAHVRINPRLYTLPVVLLMGEMTREDIAAAYQSGVTRICRQPIDAQMVRATVGTLIRRQSFHWRVARELDNLVSGQAAGPLPRMVTQAYMNTYLQARLDACDEGGDFAMTYLRAETAEQLARDSGKEAADHLIAQLAPYIGRMLRAEDMAASDGSGGFFCVLPKTGLAEARMVMERIVGIIAVTDFAVPDVFHPVKVWPRFSATLATGADTPETMISALRAGLSSMIGR